MRTPINAVDLFRFMGRLCARSLLDERILDLRFSPVFIKAVTHPEARLGVDDLHSVEPALASHLSRLRQLCLEKDLILSDESLVLLLLYASLFHFAL